MAAILPGATIAILGGGQLGRMAAMAARSLGYGVTVLDPDPACAASGVADRVIVASFDDLRAASELAEHSAVVTYEIEKISPAVIEAAERYAPVRPGGDLLAMVQDRAKQKSWLEANGFPVGPFAVVAAAAEVTMAMRRWQAACRLKTRQGGYDGRGQVGIPHLKDVDEAWAQMAVPCVAERELDLKAELSVLVARRPSGEIAVYPPAENWHTDGILAVSLMPGLLSEPIKRRAGELAHQLAEKQELVGLLAVEFFLTADDELLINELSPRPHNTFHTTDTACVTSQFEQLIRAICDLPLGATDIVRPTALANLLGDLWLSDQPPGFESALSLSGVRLHLYGKSPRLGRKVGHLLASAATPEAALKLIDEAKRRFARAPRG